MANTSELLDRKSGIVLRQRTGSGFRTPEVIELPPLDPATEGIRIRKCVKDGSHPPGETLGLPDPRKHTSGIAVDPGWGMLGVEFDERLGQCADIARGEV